VFRWLEIKQNDRKHPEATPPTIAIHGPRPAIAEVKTFFSLGRSACWCCKVSKLSLPFVVR